MSKKLSEQAIDNIVEIEAAVDSAWEEPIFVQKTEAASFMLPGDLAKRAIFLAKLHREGTVEKWLMRIIKERIELEEGAFNAAKYELALHTHVT